MIKLLSRPIVIGISTGLLLIFVCLIVPIPLYDGVFYYKNGLVQFQNEGKVALRYMFDLNSSRLSLYGIQPTSFELKKMGWVMVVLIHIGLPTLIGLRLFFAQEKRKFEQNSHSVTPKNEHE